MIYGVDIASYQGKPSWPTVYQAGIRFAFSKVSQSINYLNPTWHHNLAGMTALGPSFLPGCYHFLTSGTAPSLQAQYFLKAAGDVSKLAVALDVEPAEGSRPTDDQARAWVAEFKDRTGGHPVIGYYPRWWWEQTGRPDLSFFDTVWQSRYVSGTGSPNLLYSKAPDTWWTSFGGEPISILQFSSSASVPGITGHVDVNAYRGTLDQLRALALGQEQDDMEPTTKVTITPFWKESGQFSHDSYSAGFLWQGSVAETRAYGKRILAALEAQRATIDKLVDALSLAAPDMETLKAEIREAIESVTVRLDVEDEPAPPPPA